MSTKIILGFILGMATLTCLSLALSAEPTKRTKPEAKASLSIASSCAIDLDNDKRDDLVIVVKTREGAEVWALLRRGTNPEAHLLHRVGNDKNPETPLLTCKTGGTITETLAGKGDRKTPRTFATNGKYVEIVYPECSSITYFWDKDHFTEVWTSD